jgi:hypothetical protein
MQLQGQSEEAMITVAIADLDKRFGSIDRPRIAATVRRRVHYRFLHSRVKAFVGIIAERDARAELQLVLIAAERGR